MGWVMRLFQVVLPALKKVIWQLWQVAAQKT